LIKYIILKLLLIVCTYGQTIYYVDKDKGADGNNGTTVATPWETVAKINGESFSAGDAIYFRTDDTWREILTIPSSGSAGSPITFSSYDSAAVPLYGTDCVGEQPIINNSILTSTWIDYSGSYANTWYTVNSNEPLQVLFDGTRGTEESSASDLNAANEWFWTTAGSDTLIVYSTADPDAEYTNPGIEISKN